jgi:hypothetical protein
MKTHRVWVEIMLLGSAVACALALLLATLGAAAGAAVGKNGPQHAVQTAAEQAYSGMVTCSRCGAKHSPTLGKTAADCVGVCVRDGAQFSLVDGDQTYILDGDMTLLKKVAGQRARIVGAINGRTIKVSSVATT